MYYVLALRIDAASLANGKNRILLCLSLHWAAKFKTPAIHYMYGFIYYIVLESMNFAACAFVFILASRGLEKLAVYREDLQCVVNWDYGLLITSKLLILHARSTRRYIHMSYKHSANKPLRNFNYHIVFARVIYEFIFFIILNSKSPDHSSV